MIPGLHLPLNGFLLITVYLHEYVGVFPRVHDDEGFLFRYFKLPVNIPAQDFSRRSPSSTNRPCRAVTATFTSCGADASLLDALAVCRSAGATLTAVPVFLGAGSVPLGAATVTGTPATRTGSPPSPRAATGAVVPWLDAAALGGSALATGEGVRFTNRAWMKPTRGPHRGSWNRISSQIPLVPRISTWLSVAKMRNGDSVGAGFART
jgi:hypothetical protein